MLRFLVTVLIWIVLIGGMSLYMGGRRPAAVHHTEQEHHEEILMEDCALEVTPTFDLKPDPFALQTDDTGEAKALVVRMGSDTVLALADEVKGGSPVRVDPLEGLKEGQNEFYLEANPPLDDFGQSFAVRLRVFCGERTLTDRTLWSDPGGKAAGTVLVDIGRTEDR